MGFFGNWIDSRIRRVIREEEAALTFDVRGIVAGAEEYQRKAIDAAVAASLGVDDRRD